MKENYQNLYKCLLKSEELLGMFPGMSGEWEKDSKKFIEAQTEVENLANIQILDLDDETEYIY